MEYVEAALLFFAKHVLAEDFYCRPEAILMLEASHYDPYLTRMAAHLSRRSVSNRYLFSEYSYSIPRENTLLLQLEPGKES
jgi:hypothetical protein